MPYPWKPLLESLRIYYSQHGDCVIDNSFTVPFEEPWPEELRGEKLARLVYNMDFWKTHIAPYPNRRPELNELKFIWGRLQPEYNLVVEALLVFKEIEGHLNVPSKFVVPCNQLWPKSVWRLKLGYLVSDIRCRNRFVGDDGGKWFQLQSMGFVWEASDVKWERFFSALQMYVDTTGNALIPRSFLVPREDPWPLNLWGYKLGIAVYNVRSKGTYVNDRPERIRALNQLGFVWDPGEYAFEQFLEALNVFKQIHGHTRVPQQYICPESDAWPSHLHGYRLGARRHTIRLRGDLVKNYPDRRVRLELLGFE